MACHWPLMEKNGPLYSIARYVTRVLAHAHLYTNLVRLSLYVRERDYVRLAMADITKFLTKNTTGEEDTSISNGSRDSGEEMGSTPSRKCGPTSTSPSPVPASLSSQSRKRKYNAAWGKSFPWLAYKKETSTMICTPCKKAKADTGWASTGCEKLKKDSIVRHAH